MHDKVVAALRRLQREQRTGIFRSAVEDLERAVFFERGGIVGAQTSIDDERLGETMLRHGRISPVQQRNASKLVLQGMRFGDALVELNVVGRDEVEAFVRTQLAEITSKFLTAPPKKLEFREGTKIGKVTDRPVLVADAILEAARHEPLGNKLPSLLTAELVPTLLPDAMSVLDAVSLKSHEAYVLSRCDGMSRVKDIFAQSPLVEEETARVLLGLELAGIIEMEGPGAKGH